MIKLIVNLDDKERLEFEKFGMTTCIALAIRCSYGISVADLAIWNDYNPETMEYVTRMTVNFKARKEY